MGKLTRRDIAKAAGVSPSTVSRALSGSPLLPRGTIDRIRAIAAEMGYAPNTLARQLAMNRSMRMGYVVPHRTTRKGPLQVSYFAVILDAMVAAAGKLGYEISIMTYDEEGAETAARLADGVKTRRVDGLVVVGLRLASNLACELARRKLPLVLLEANPELEGVAQILCDPLPAMKTMLAKLAENGYERFYFVSGDMGYYHASAQKAALMEALRQTRRAPTLVREIRGNYTRRSGYAAAEALISECGNGDFVFLSNDRMASGFYRYCQEHGVRIPDRVGVVGSDDDEAAAALFPDLTTIRQPRVEMGEAAVATLAGILDGNPPEVKHLEKEFVQRASTRACALSLISG